MTRLRICEACSRHVFVSETQCPFCAVPLAPLRGTPNFKLGRRMSRAQRVAVAGAVASLIGCQDGFVPAPAYGAPVPPPDAGSVSSGTGGAAVPADVDAGTDDAGDEHSDLP
jgi:hypothetical protein